MCFVFFFQAEDGIRDVAVTGVQTCALPISLSGKALVRVACAEFPERGMPRGTLAGLCVGAGRNQPTLHDFLQETVLYQAFAVDSAQVVGTEHTSVVFLDGLEHVKGFS